jgi:hypothetical protein
MRQPQQRAANFLPQYQDAEELNPKYTQNVASQVQEGLLPVDSDEEEQGQHYEEETAGQQAWDVRRVDRPQSAGRLGKAGRVSAGQEQDEEDEESEEYSDQSQQGPVAYQPYVPTGYVMPHPHHFQDAELKSQSARKARRDSARPLPTTPSTARSMKKAASASKINPVIRRAPGLAIKKSDPVKRFQKLQSSWKKDTFLRRESQRTNTLWQC